MSSNSFDTKEKQIDSTLTSGDTNYTVFQCLHLLVYNCTIKTSSLTHRLKRFVTTLLTRVCAVQILLLLCACLCMSQCMVLWFCMCANRHKYLSTGNDYNVLIVFMSNNWLSFKVSKIMSYLSTLSRCSNLVLTNNDISRATNILLHDNTTEVLLLRTSPCSIQRPHKMKVQVQTLHTRAHQTTVFPLVTNKTIQSQT